MREDLGVREVVVVHRPKYDDWTLPKGKAKRGETDEDCAVREIEEETGFVCRLGAELPSSEYIDGEGRPKIARYWLMQPVAGALRAAHEIDDARWVPFHEAEELLTYDRDRRVLRAAAQL
jgi:8-oxo-dGTP diphosphatase